jgi:hypothetical protein
MNLIYRFTDPTIEPKLRDLANRIIQAKWKKCDPNKTEQESTFEGIRAEYGFCDILHIPFDWRLKPWGDGGIDFIVSGKRCQMKYNNWRPPTGELYFRESQPFDVKVKIAILSVPVFVNDRGKGVGLGDIEYVGWTGRPRFFKFCRDHVWPGECETPVKTMKAKDLKPMEDLRRFLFPLSYAAASDLKQAALF